MTEQQKAKVLPRLLLTIVKEEDQKELEALFDSMHVPIWFQCRGEGTASSEMMDIFGLRGTGRLITVGLMPRLMSKAVLEALEGRFSLHKKGGGIALTIPVTGLQSHVLQILSEETRAAIQKTVEGEEEAMKETAAYAMLLVSVADGYSDDVVDAARAAGARGGTIIRGRRRNSERATQYFGISLQEEQDFVMIVVPRAQKAEIMAAISNACGFQTEAHGLVLSVPVDETLGLE